MRDTLAIFPTPVWIEMYDCGETTREYLSNLPLRQIQKTDSVNTYGRFTENTYVLNEETCKELSERILTSATDILHNIMCYDIGEVRFTQSWVSHKFPGQQHSVHLHPNSILSGVYYFEDDAPIEPLVFHKSFSNSNYSIEIAANYEKSRNSEFCWTTYQINPQKDMLVFFPSYLQHSVGVNVKNTVRKSLAFNIVPKDGFGIPVGLSELKFA
jgi:uncharacterized protein (TIGR02466 family)